VLARSILAMLLLGLAAGCGRKPDGAGGGRAGGGVPEAGVLAQVNDEQLTESDLQRLVPEEAREGITGGEIRGILDRWVRSELLYQKAVEDGLEKDPRVAVRLRELQRELLADEMLQRELGKRAHVNAAEIQAWYSSHQKEYQQDVQLKQIVLGTREEADDVLQQLRSGASFEALAQQRSIDPSGAHGGDLGFVGRGAMNPAFQAYAFDMQVGEVLGPIPTSFGFHVVKLVARRDAVEPIPFETARDEIMHELLRQKQQRAEAELIQELRGAAQVSMATSFAGMSLAPDSSHAEPLYAPRAEGGGREPVDETAPQPPRTP
jgi:peptidyl-prolyl cis-trans isomerase C